MKSSIVRRAWLEASSRLYLQVLERHEPMDRVVSFFRRKNRNFGSKDFRFISETVYAMIRVRRLLEWALGEDCSAKNAELFVVTWLVACDDREAKGLPTSDAIRTQALQARARIRTDLPDALSAEGLALRWSMPDWLMNSLLAKESPEQVDALCEGLRQRAPLTIRANTLKCTREELAAQLLKEGIESSPTLLSPWGLQLHKRVNFHTSPSFKRGLFSIQDEGSQLIAILSGAAPKTSVLDACAGAGGKTLAMAAMMQNKGTLYAADNSERRLEGLKPRARAAGVSNIQQVVVSDHGVGKLKRMRGKFQTVLVDAPCSGLGVLRRNPDAPFKLSPAEIEGYHQVQRTLLQRYASLLQAGGSLVYATCSLMERENTAVVEAFLDENSDFRLLPAESVFADAGLALPCGDSFMRLRPDVHNTDGFFAARLVKKS